MLSSLEQSFKALEASKSALLNRLSGLSADCINQRPNPGAWSLAEIAQHLMLVEEEALRQFKAATPTNDRQTIRDRAGRLMVHFVFRRGIRVKAPFRSVIPDSAKSLQEIRTSWNEVRSVLRAHLDSIQPDGLEALLFRHPVAGRMNVRQTLKLLELHFKHHLRQVDRTESLVTAKCGS